MVRRSICNGPPAKGMKEGTCLTTITEVEISNESKHWARSTLRYQGSANMRQTSGCGRAGAARMHPTRKMWRMVA